MDSPKDILARAHERALAQNLPYAGSLLPTEAHDLLSQDASAKLVDVRTRAEWEWVGKVPDAVQVEWNTWPGGRNPQFLDELRVRKRGSSRGGHGGRGGRSRGLARDVEFDFLGAHRGEAERQQANRDDGFQFHAMLWV